MLDINYRRRCQWVIKVGRTGGGRCCSSLDLTRGVSSPPVSSSYSAAMVCGQNRGYYLSKLLCEYYYMYYYRLLSCPCVWFPVRRCVDASGSRSRQGRRLPNVVIVVQASCEAARMLNRGCACGASGDNTTTPAVTTTTHGDNTRFVASRIMPNYRTEAILYA